MTDDYRSPRLYRLGFDFENSVLTEGDTALRLSRKDVLGIVQVSYEELGSDDPALIVAKQDVLEEVAQGKLAHALRTAIIGAGQSRCICCNS